MKFSTLNQLPLYTDEFFWRRLNDRKEDALVVFNPIDSIIISPVYLRSRKSLAEHIALIRDNGITDVIAVAEDIGFLKQCETIECLRVHPAITSQNFDYSPIYELPRLKWLQCETSYGEKGEYISSIDYSRFPNLKWLSIIGSKGHLNVQKADNVVSLFFDEAFPKSADLKNVIPTKNLEMFSITRASIRSLEGIDAAKKLKKLELYYNRSLTDISALAALKDSLVSLTIEKCGRIHDFSVLKELSNLECLILKGSNTIPDLKFLLQLPKLKHLHITMNVADGDMHWCQNVPYVKIQNRKHYSHKDSEMPQNFIDPIIIAPNPTV